MKRNGFKSGSFCTSEKISRKWRYLSTQHHKVIDNNDKTGKGKMKFKYFDVNGLSTQMLVAW